MKGRGPALVLTAVALGGALVVLSCGDLGEGWIVSPGPSVIGRAEEFISFDHGGKYLMKWGREVDGEFRSYQDWEPVVWEEASLGEPFIDVDSDGVYEPTVDTFDVARHDLNSNGRYDSPEDSWTPRVPFDDLNGDGICQTEIPSIPDGYPFADLNGNGICDQILFCTEYKVCSLAVQDAGNWTANLLSGSGFYEMVSDSGVRYSHPDDQWGGYAVGVICEAIGGKLSLDLRGGAVCTLDTGIIERRSIRTPGSGNVRYSVRTVDHMEELRIASKVYRDVLRVTDYEVALNGDYILQRFCAVRGGEMLAGYTEQVIAGETLGLWQIFERFSDDPLPLARP